MTRKEKIMHRVRLWTVAALLLVVMGTAVCVADNRPAAPGMEFGETAETQTTDAAPAPVSSDEIQRASNSFVQLARNATPAVVNLEVVKRVSGRQIHPRFHGGDPFWDFFERFGVPEQDRVQRGQGSGFIISQDGYIITNNHVVSDAEKVTVRLHDERELKADVIGVDPKTDVALIKVTDGVRLPVLPLGDSDALQVGEWVVAIGNPFGLSHTVTAGIVSAKGRVVGMGSYDDFIQTDASINPGNSGGPLINTRGELIGINTLINASGQGIGFAIPVNLARGIVDQLKEHGKVTRGWLGVLIQEVTPDLAQALKLDEAKGALVGNVLTGSPAEKAQLKSGDVIVRFDGKDVAASRDLPIIVADTEIGKSVNVEIVRDGKTMTVEVEIGLMPDDAGEPEEQDHGGELGLVVQDIPFEMARQLGLNPGEGAMVVNVETGSAASDAGLRRGDVVLELNRKRLSGASDFAGGVAAAKKGESLLLLVKREDATFYTTIEK
ncbi:MAG: DegQ family serine endoprotease [Deltaproteobacteria bacterium]|nr:DegQ family serine endoprotease [Deltaproteobacteria bacterium]